MVGEMITKSWGTYYQLFDKKLGSRIRDLMAIEANAECLYGSKELAAKKLKEFAGLNDQ